MKTDPSSHMYYPHLRIFWDIPDPLIHHRDHVGQIHKAGKKKSINIPWKALQSI